MTISARSSPPQIGVHFQWAWVAPYGSSPVGSGSSSIGYSSASRTPRPSPVAGREGSDPHSEGIHPDGIGTTHASSVTSCSSGRQPKLSLYSTKSTPSPHTGASGWSQPDTSTPGASGG